MKMKFDFSDDIPEDDRKRLRNDPRVHKAIERINDILDNAKTVKGENFVIIVLGLANTHATLHLMVHFGKHLIDSGAPTGMVKNYTVLMEMVAKMQADMARRAMHFAGMKSADVDEAIKLAETLSDTSILEIPDDDDAKS